MESDKVLRPDVTIIHFNDSYRVDERNVEPVGGVARIRTAIKKYESVNPLVTFGGDLFSPSILSMVTKGKHMTQVTNLMGIQYSVVGNHDFDFSVDNLSSLIKDCKYPWLLSNVTQIPKQPDMRKGNQLVNSVEYEITERNGIKIGLIGLVEEEWITTLTINKSEIFYLPFIEEGRRLATYLKQTQNVQIVVALTHMRLPNDEILAQNVPEIDIILGGHDHFVATKTVNDTLIAKSGEDFQNITVIQLWHQPGLKPKVIPQVVPITRDFAPDTEMNDLVKFYQDVMTSKLSKKIAYSHVVLDASVENVRTREANIGNYVCDIMRLEFDADIAMINGGTIRSGEKYGPGIFTLKELMQLFPMEDIIILIEATGEQLLSALENSFSQFPKHEGRFAQLSGLSVKWDARQPPGKRVISVFVGDVTSNKLAPLILDKTYKIATKTYMIEGRDGYDSLQNVKVLIDKERGKLLSHLIRTHLLKEKTLNVLRSHNNLLHMVKDKFLHKDHEEEMLPVIRCNVEGRIVRVDQ